MGGSGEETSSHVADDRPSDTQQTPKNNRVYVGNLAWKVGWQDLKDHMRGAGGNVLRADVFMDVSGRSRGCGVVEFETPEQALKAIQELGDTELKDRKIFVREDREEPGRENSAPSRRNFRGNYQRGGYSRGGGFRQRYGGSDNSRNGNEPVDGYYGGRGGGGGGGSRAIPEENKDCQVFVSNLAWRTSWQDLKDLFRDAGNVVRADVYQRDGMSRGCGTVLFSSPKEAENAVDKFNDCEVDGRQISVRIDQGPRNYQ